MCSESIFKESIDESSIVDLLIIRYTDDTVIIATNMEDLKNLMEWINTISKAYESKEDSTWSLRKPIT